MRLSEVFLWFTVYLMLRNCNLLQKFNEWQRKAYLTPIQYRQLFPENHFQSLARFLGLLVKKVEEVEFNNFSKRKSDFILIWFVLPWRVRLWKTCDW